ncbi:MAG TPA: DUF2167 domain-containing protein, partial [Planctomycetota bacterium]|nr:DUF2167 domain-containing protein [Planctomycetota bacterium]
MGFASRPLLAQQEEPAPAPPAQSQEPGSEAPVEGQMPGIAGPTLADLGTIAQIQVPEGCHFLGAADSRRFLEENGNISSQRELGIVLNAEPSWFVVFEYSDEGHIKDDDKDDLDADEIWKMLKSGNEAGNEEKKRRGWPTLTLVGWTTKP